MRFGSRLLVNLESLASNYQSLKSICPNNDVLFMVKANAYGHGLVDITSFACRELGIKNFGCATLGEALCLRDQIPNEEFDLYVFSDVQLGNREFDEVYLSRRILPVISSLKDLEYFLSNSDFKNFPLVLFFNTGMNRLGIEMDELEKVGKLLKRFDRKAVFHLMTHFANASFSMKTNKRNILQRENFKKAKDFLKAEGIEVEHSSISNSGAIEQQVGLEETHVRPGIMMYGPSSLLPKYKSEGVYKGKIISSLQTYIIKVFDVERGQPIGYGSTPMAKDGRVAILALGYGDGFNTHYLGTELMHKGHKGIVAGRVNMDMAQVLFDKDVDISPGEPFTIWGEDPDSLEKMCEQIGTISYQLFCQITSRVPRVYTMRQGSPQ